jgi:catechol 2,3-dioxygenase-like lactoylglutathione lyase family enzyme
MIQCIDHVNIVVSNLTEAKAIFALLGFKECDASRLSGEWISSITGLPHVEARYVALEIEGSSTRLELIEYESPVSGTVHKAIGVANEVGIRHLAFRVEDIHGTVKHLLDHGIQLLGPVQTYPKTGKKLVYFLGPDGILLELAQYSQ